MKLIILIPLTHRVSKASCGNCRFLVDYEVDGLYCMLFHQTVAWYENPLFFPDEYKLWATRPSNCLKLEVVKKDIHYIPYTVEFDGYGDTCGDCLLQYISLLKGKFRTCPAFGTRIKFLLGLNVEGDDVYECHYRCRKCKDSVIKVDK